jgi:hypothetical protein
VLLTTWLGSGGNAVDTFLAELDDKLATFREDERIRTAGADEALLKSKKTLNVIHDRAIDYEAALRVRQIHASVFFNADSLKVEMRWPNDRKHSLSALIVPKSGGIEFIHSSWDDRSGQLTSGDRVHYMDEATTLSKFAIEIEKLIKSYISGARHNGGIVSERP